MKDWTALLLLQAISQNGNVFKTGATYRVSADYWGMSCQYWMPPSLLYMAPTENIYVTGVGKGLWADSKECGRCLLVKYGNRSQIVVVADYCPACSNMQLDLSQEASAYLTKGKVRNFAATELSVQKVGCNWGKQAKLYLHKDSSVYVWYIIPLFFSFPPRSINVLGVDAEHDKYGRFVVSFKGVKPKCDKNYPVRVDSNTMYLSLDCSNRIEL